MTSDKERDLTMLVGYALSETSLVFFDGEIVFISRWKQQKQTSCLFPSITSRTEFWSRTKATSHEKVLSRAENILYQFLTKNSNFDG